MTNNTGKVKKHKKKFQFINRNGSRIHRREFIETDYIKGVSNEAGEKVIRAMNSEEIDWLNNYYKEFVHGTFNTDNESKKLFKKVKTLTKKKENVKFFNENGFFPEDVEQAIESFNKKSKSLGNLAYDFWQQREINSDDHKRRNDIQNNAAKGIQLESFEEIQNMIDFEEVSDTKIEDLITQSEE